LCLFIKSSIATRINANAVSPPTIPPTSLGLTLRPEFEAEPVDVGELVAAMPPALPVPPPLPPLSLPPPLVESITVENDVDERVADVVVELEKDVVVAVR
jgi:hypothetical protein